MPDLTLDEMKEFCTRVLNDGGTFWTKFTCEHCGARQTFEEKNTIFTSGTCEECGHTTKLNKWGLMVMY